MTQLKESELLHLENLDTSSCKSMLYTFSNSGIDKLDLTGFDVSNVLTAFAMFFKCSSLTELNISNWELPKVGSDGSGNLESFLLLATNLETIDISALNPRYCGNLRNMFQKSSKLKSINFGNVFTFGENASQTKIDQMFEGCTSLETLDLSKWNVSNLQNCQKMFKDCSALTDVKFDGGTWSVIRGDAQYNIAARSYLRYYDANGKLRVFYNDYKNNAGNTYYGGCMCSYDQIYSVALSTN